MVAFVRLRIRCKECGKKFSGVRGERRCRLCSINYRKDELTPEIPIEHDPEDELPRWCPTPEQIKVECERIQAGWTEEVRYERRTRCV